MTLKIKEYNKDPLSQNLMTNSLLIFLFSRNCEPEIVLPVQLKSKQKQFYVRNLYKTRKSTMNRSSNFGLIKKAIDLSRILLAVLYIFWQSQTYFGCMAQAVCQFLQRGQY